MPSLRKDPQERVGLKASANTTAHSLCGVPSRIDLGSAQVEGISFKTRFAYLKVKLQLRVRVNGRYDIFRAILYRTQVVAGTMYFIKVQVADTEYVHLKVFVGLPPENLYPALVSFQTGKTRDDPLDYF
ncbi:cystatin-B-like isoform X2 [Manacus candei]|uniref:cystatin-B-like isoform X2 n=1 Tax=Manacus candei TaxID=415023 RepID=UPI002226E381|nr:cystatin-B-like isoform X2 [Manacus candei]